MIRTRKDKGYFVGLYLEKQQYDILHDVSSRTGISVSNLVRAAIAIHVEPMYQANLSQVNTNDKSS
jgi:hypothetical protein